MPRAEYKDAPGLSIKLQPSPLQQQFGSDAYLPGDTLRGTVSLTISPTEDTAVGSVVVNFYGRTKVKIVKSNASNSHNVYRGRGTLFDLSHVLYSGQYTHKAGSKFSWPFEFLIPRSVVGGGVGEKYRDSGGRFWDDEEVQGRELPPNMKYIHRGWNDDARGFVEYVLTATVSDPKGSHLFSGLGKKVSVRPVTLMSQLRMDGDGSDGVVRDWKMRKLFQEVTVRTLRLLPAYATSESLSFRERSRSIFKRDTLPRMTFVVNVSVPGVIQVCSPDYIPLVVGFAVNPDPQMTTVGRESLVKVDEKSEDTNDDHTGNSTFPRIIVRSFSISLCCTTSVRVPGSIYDREDSKTHTIPLVENRIFNLPVDIPFPSQSSPNPFVSIDLGTSCKLKIEQGNVTGGSKLEFPLVGTFRTSNIARSFKWKYSIDVECAGKSETISNSTLLGDTLGVGGVQVLGPPMDFMRNLGGQLGPTVSLDDEDDDDDNSDSGNEKGGKPRKNEKGRFLSKAAEAEEDRAGSSWQRDHRFEGDDGAAGAAGDPEQGGEQLPKYEA